MKYRLNNTNYKDFETYQENVMNPRSYYIPFGDAEKLAATDIRTERYASDRVSLLSGRQAAL